MGRLFTSLYHDLLRLIAWGPATDPNKVAPIMAQYIASEDWPEWCKLSTHAPHLIKGSFLSSSLANQGTGLVQEVDNIRLRKLTHYKCHTDWNHEFIRADYVYATTNKNLVAVWERDLTVINPEKETKRAVKIKAGLRCESIDRVTYITEKDFADFVKTKKAYILRTATFPEPGPTHLQVAAVLETHSLSFPMYHIYSTMCYWYAGSTFEVLVDISGGKVKIENHTAEQGRITFGPVKAKAYTGITRKAASTSPAATGVSYEQHLVNIETEVNNKFDRTETASESAGWDVSKFLEMVQTMPKHDELLNASKTRAAEVRAQLEDIQSGREDAKAAERREAEANMCAVFEAKFAEKEARWKKEKDELQKKNKEQQKTIEEQQKIIEEQQKEMKKKDEEHHKQMMKKDEEHRKAIEELQKVNEQQ